MQLGGALSRYLQNLHERGPLRWLTQEWDWHCKGALLNHLPEDVASVVQSYAEPLFSEISSAAEPFVFFLRHGCDFGAFAGDVLLHESSIIYRTLKTIYIQPPYRSLDLGPIAHVLPGSWQCSWIWSVKGGDLLLGLLNEELGLSTVASMSFPRMGLLQQSFSVDSSYPLNLNAIRCPVPTRKSWEVVSLVSEENYCALVCEDVAGVFVVAAEGRAQRIFCKGTVKKIVVFDETAQFIHTAEQQGVFLAEGKQAGPQLCLIERVLGVLHGNRVVLLQSADEVVVASVRSVVTLPKRPRHAVIACWGNQILFRDAEGNVEIYDLETKITTALNVRISELTCQRGPLLASQASWINMDTHVCFSGHPGEGFHSWSRTHQTTSVWPCPDGRRLLKPPLCLDAIMLL